MAHSTEDHEESVKYLSLKVFNITPDVPLNVIEDELIEKCTPFGNCNVIVVGEIYDLFAYVNFEKYQDARNCMEQFNRTPLEIGGFPAVVKPQLTVKKRYVQASDEIGEKRSQENESVPRGGKSPHKRGTFTKNRLLSSFMMRSIASKAKAYPPTSKAKTLIKRPCHILYVTSLDPEATEKDLERICRKFGFVLNVSIKTASFRKFNFAFVAFLNVDMAIRAKREMTGKRIKNYVPVFGFGKTSLNNILWVSDIGSSMDEDKLYDMFSAYGKVRSIKRPNGKDYAFVVFEKVRDAESAVEDLHGTCPVNYGRRIFVIYCSNEQMDSELNDRIFDFSGMENDNDDEKFAYLDDVGGGEQVVRRVDGTSSHVDRFEAESSTDYAVREKRNEFSRHSATAATSPSHSRANLPRPLLNRTPPGSPPIVSSTQELRKESHFFAAKESEPKCFHLQANEEEEDFRYSDRDEEMHGEVQREDEYGGGYDEREDSQQRFRHEERCDGSEDTSNRYFSFRGRGRGFVRGSGFERGRGWTPRGRRGWFQRGGRSWINRGGRGWNERGAVHSLFPSSKDNVDENYQQWQEDANKSKRQSNYYDSRRNDEPQAEPVGKREYVNRTDAQHVDNRENKYLNKYRNERSVENQNYSKDYYYENDHHQKSNYRNNDEREQMGKTFEHRREDSDYGRQDFGDKDERWFHSERSNSRSFERRDDNVRHRKRSREDDDYKEGRYTYESIKRGSETRNVDNSNREGGRRSRSFESKSRWNSDHRADYYAEDTRVVNSRDTSCGKRAKQSGIISPKTQSRSRSKSVERNWRSAEKVHDSRSGTSEKDLSNRVVLNNFTETSAVASAPAYFGNVVVPNIFNQFPAGIVSEPHINMPHYSAGVPMVMQPPPYIPGMVPVQTVSSYSPFSNQPTFVSSVTPYNDQLTVSSYPPYNDQPAASSFTPFNDQPPAVASRSGVASQITEHPKKSSNVSLDNYPVVWSGALVLKNSAFVINLHLLSGSVRLVDTLLHDQSSPDCPALKITQRLRLDQPDKLNDLERSVASCDRNSCSLLLASSAKAQIGDMNNVIQQRPLKGLMMYLMEKQCAAVVFLPPGCQDNDKAGVLHAFPPCDFTTKFLQKEVADLAGKLATVDHLFILILRENKSHA